MRTKNTDRGHGRGDTAGFLVFLIPQAALLLAGIVAAFAAELNGELRGMLVVACGLPCAGLIWLIVWVARNPMAGHLEGRAVIGLPPAGTTNRLDFLGGDAMGFVHPARRDAEDGHDEGSTAARGRAQARGDSAARAAGRRGPGPGARSGDHPR